MYKKTIKFEDFDGNERSEDHYFNLTKAEVIKWLTTNGDYTLDKKLKRLAEERNGKEAMVIFEDLIHMSYGKKSLDGRKFMKNEEIWLDFKETEAYSELFMELVSGGKSAADFISGILPKDLTDAIDQMIKENPEEAKKAGLL